MTALSSLAGRAGALELKMQSLAQPDKLDDRPTVLMPRRTLSTIASHKYDRIFFRYERVYMMMSQKALQSVLIGTRRTFEDITEKRIDTFLLATP